MLLHGNPWKWKRSFHRANRGGHSVFNWDTRPSDHHRLRSARILLWCVPVRSILWVATLRYLFPLQQQARRWAFYIVLCKNAFRFHSYYIANFHCRKLKLHNDGFIEYQVSTSNLVGQWDFSSLGVDTEVDHDVVKPKVLTIYLPDQVVIYSFMMDSWLVKKTNHIVYTFVVSSIYLHSPYMGRSSFCHSG